jgi:hypothetical protein
MQHIDINTVRPDAIVRSGTIQPFPMEVGPYAVADVAMQSFAPDGLHGAVVTPGRGQTAAYDPYEPQPEEVAMMIKRLAVAMSQGLMPTGVVDPALMQGARLMMAGQEFTIRSAGRVALVRGSNPPPSDPASTEARRIATR